METRQADTEYNACGRQGFAGFCIFTFFTSPPFGGCHFFVEYITQGVLTFSGTCANSNDNLIRQIIQQNTKLEQSDTNTIDVTRNNLTAFHHSPHQQTYSHSSANPYSIKRSAWLASRMSSTIKGNGFFESNFDTLNVDQKRPKSGMFKRTKFYQFQVARMVL